MGLWNKSKKIFYDAVNSNSSPGKLALSFSVGIFIAFSPFPGGHTVIMFAARWLLGLNFPILFLATSFNNPWTLVPFYSFDYYFGHWFVHKFLGWNPSFVISLGKIFGSCEVCLVSFFVGGSVLGLVCGALSYPFMLYLFRAFSDKWVSE